MYLRYIFYCTSVLYRRIHIFLYHYKTLQNYLAEKNTNKKRYYFLTAKASTYLYDLKNMNYDRMISDN